MRIANECEEEVERPLTDRELEILRLLSAGMSTESIARGLSISPTTVRNHVQRIIAKLKVHSRLGAVAEGYARGLIPLGVDPGKG
jgi:DNA-binding CsgD family transcriptional regulator